MENAELNTYYAIIWDTELNTDMEIEGEELTSASELPKEDMIRYGTHENDIAIARVKVLKEKKIYDWLTTKQTSEFYVEEEKYELKRDLRIIVWEGEDGYLNLLGSYKVITPDFFSQLVKLKRTEQAVEEESKGSLRSKKVEIIPTIFPVEVSRGEFLREIS